MKRIILIFMVSISLGLSSCDSFLSPDNVDALDATKAFESLSDAEAALNGAYASLLWSGYFVTETYLADNIKMTVENTSGGGRFVHAWDYASDNTFSSLWSNRYATIYYVNDLLGNIDNISVSEEETADIDRVKGEALFIRAFALHDLVKHFAQPYTDGRDNMGVPVLLANDAFSFPSRNTVGETYDAIVADLAMALELVGDQGFTALRVNEVTIHALLARVKLHMGLWDDAIDHADFAITNGPILSTGATYRSMFNDQSDGEIIFKIFVESGGAIGTSFYFPEGTPDTDASYTITEDLIALYESGDIRGDGLNFIENPNDPGEIVVYKHNGKAPMAAPPIYYNDLKYIRTSEIYLIRAEAKYKSSSSSDGEALDDLNIIRTARSASTGSEGGNTLFEAIKTERRKELSYEAFRFSDLKRWGDSIERGSDCSVGQCTLSAGDPRFNLPIPLNELTANDNMVQNSGY